jgi:hypothetical protein
VTWFLNRVKSGSGPIKLDKLISNKSRFGSAFLFYSPKAGSFDNYLIFGD